MALSCSLAVADRRRAAGAVRALCRAGPAVAPGLNPSPGPSLTASGRLRLVSVPLRPLRGLRLVPPAPSRVPPAGRRRGDGSVQSNYKIKRDDYTEVLLSLPFGPLKIDCHEGAFDMLHILELTCRPS